MAVPTSARRWFVIVVMLWAVALVGAWLLKGLQVSRSGLANRPGTRVANGSAAPSSDIVIYSSSGFQALDPEENLIWRAEYIAHGTVTSVSTSCWNNESCSYAEPNIEFVGEEEDSFLPFQYYTATISIDDEWYDTLGLGSTVVLTRTGPSPYDSVLLSDIADPIPDDEEVVIMAVRKDVTFLEGDQTFDWLTGLYRVNADDSLTTTVYQPSTTLSGLAARVGTVKAYTPTPTSEPSPTATSTPTPCSGVGC